MEPRFHIPGEAGAEFRKTADRGAQLAGEWENRLAAYGRTYPDLKKEWDRLMTSGLPAGWDGEIPVFPADPKGTATRSAGGQVMNAIAPKLSFLIGGSADLDPSTNTALKKLGNFQPSQSGGGDVQGAVSGPWGYEGANMAFGVREHAMGSILNGVALHGGLLPYGSTFFVFSDYMRPAIRLAALMKLHVIYVFTHDSIALGEDGPTHQPIEHLSSLRAMPGLTVIRPADANETAEAWRVAVEKQDGPVALIMTRQVVPVIDRSKYAAAAGVRKGAYVLADSGEGEPQIILIATGSEVHLALEAYEKVRAEGIRVRIVNMASWDLFERQPKEYRHEVLPPRITKRISVEAGATHGWHKYTGLEGEVFGIDRFGASAPGKLLLEKFGFTSENLYNRVKALLAK